MRPVLYPACFLWIILGLSACHAPRKVYSPQKKFSPAQLREDFDIGWKSYQKNHPSLYWYTPKDSVDRYFNSVRASLTDSLTEAEFRLRLSYAVSSIRCGHSSVIPSKAYSRYAKKAKEPMFPLQLKVWGSDSMVVLNSLTGDTSAIKRGTVIKAIDSIPAAVFIRQMKQYAYTDGFSDGFKELQISSSFPQRFNWLYGLKSSYRIGYIDPAGQSGETIVPVYDPLKKDTAKKKPADSIRVQSTQTKARAKGPSYGKYSKDSSGLFALLELNNFSHRKVPGLIRSSFKKTKKAGIHSMVLDLRTNGGGRIDNSTLLTRYIINQPFRVADSVWAKNLKPAYPRYTQMAWMYRYFSWTFARKQPDGRWHNRKTERKVHQPKKKNHFDGTLYVLTGGATFSASSLFLTKICRQPNVIVVGEETGGGARGNTAVFIPKVTLPNTGVQLRLPLFRLISDVHIPENGRGIQPTVEVITDSWHIANGLDKKMEAVKELIRKSQK
jgi:Peptidase family S41